MRSRAQVHVSVFFFFQAEDGIRDSSVTGVQTCALPICFVRDFSGSAPAGRRLRINAHGPVSVQAGNGRNISYTVHLSVRARTDAEARSVMQRYKVRVTPHGERGLLTAPGRSWVSPVTASAPRLDDVGVSSSDGPVDSANGIVRVRNMAGPVKVGAAAGLHCESGSGGINVSNIAGGMRVSTSLGNIMASLLAGKLADSFLATGNGDITVYIPSNVGVNIRAQNDLADSVRRIAVEFPGVRVRRQGRLVVAEGPVNGGGPVVPISATVGTIFIRKQP